MSNKYQILYNMVFLLYQKPVGSLGKPRITIISAFTIVFRYRIKEDDLEKLEDEHDWLKRATVLREMIKVKKCETTSLQELARNALRQQILTSLTYNQVPRFIPWKLRRVVALPEIYTIPL